MSRAIDEMKKCSGNERAVSIAMNLLKIGSLTNEQIADATELTITKVQELAKELAG